MGKNNTGENLTVGLILAVVGAGLSVILLDSWFIAIIVFIAGLGICYTMSQEDEQRSQATLPRKARKHKIDYETRIAGAYHHCDDSDIGGFIGYIQPDANNRYDRNAIGVYNNDGKLLGYIPKEETADVRRWATQPHLPCIGYILSGDKVDYWGRVTIIDTDPVRTEIEIIRTAMFMLERDGVKIIPPDFRVVGDEQPTTKKEWMKILEQRIEELEGNSGVTSE